MAAENKRRRRRRARAWKRGLTVFAVLMGMAAVIAVAVLVIGSLTRTPPEPPLPVRYEDEIRRYADERGLESAYVAAVVMAESSLNPEAVSSAGARGLMQLMPDTAQWIAGKFDEAFDKELDLDKLFDPDTNLRYGTWYLEFLMKRYDGDMRCASAAYHAGQGTVDGWLSDARYSGDGKTLAVIASDTTNTYVNRVLKYYERYKSAYAQDAA